MIGRRAYRGASSQPRRCKAGRVWVLVRTSRGVEDGDDVDREFDFVSLLGRPAKTTARVSLSLRRPFLQREARAISPPTPTPLHQGSVVFQQRVRRWSSRDDPQILRDEEREV
ncbi:hypothetical protein NL676_005295 [Syzygium grande]|nr:hypothetical protein NL676_005295 [Syzygium grande]